MLIATRPRRSSSRRIFWSVMLCTMTRQDPSESPETILAAKKWLSDSTDELDVVLHRLIERHDAAGFDLQHLSGLQREFDEVSAAVDEDGSGTCQLFEDESSPPKKPCSQLLTRAILSCTVDSANRNPFALHHDALPGSKWNG